MFADESTGPRRLDADVSEGQTLLGASAPSRVQDHDNATDALLEITGLKTHIRLRRSTVQAVDGLSFSIGAGETVGLVGESGSGKSMAGLSIMRLLPPGGAIVDGKVRFDGRDLGALPAPEMRAIRGNDIAMVFQDPMTSLNPTMKIGEQIAGPVRVHRRASRKQAEERALEVLTLVGMPRPRTLLGSYPHQLSGGLRQRVVIAIALACEPRLLIADEPTTALDVTIQGQILELLSDLQQRLQMAMLLISHDLGVIAGRTDRVMVMYAGRIIESADTESLFGAMRHPYTEGLFDSIPTLETDPSSALYSIPGLPPDLDHPPRGCRFAPRCRYVQDRCRVDDPGLTTDPGSDHAFACFFPLDARAAADASAAVAVTASEAARPQTVVFARTHSENLLVLNHVVKEFPIRRGVLQRQIGAVQAVADVSLNIAAGETFGLVGESGCGKTTLGRMIVGLEGLTSGSISFDGEEMSTLRGAKLRRHRREIQLMFQDPYASLDPRMRVRATLREPLAAQRVGSRREQDARIAELLADVGLHKRAAGMYPHEFSGGQRQRIGLARALILGPRLIVADEPVSALDVSIRSQILNLMKRLQREHDLTYIVISHDLSVVRYLADRVGVMYLGKLVEIGPAADLYERTAHPYTAGLLDAIPEPNPKRERLKDKAIVKGELPSASDPPSGCRFRTRCLRAQDVCAAVEPPLRPFGNGEHLAACHFPLQPPIEPAGVMAP